MAWRRCRRPRAAQLRDAVRDLYRYEIRRLRSELLAGHIVKRDYAGRVVALRQRYPLLSLPLPLWVEPEEEQPPPVPPLR